MFREDSSQDGKEDGREKSEYETLDIFKLEKKMLIIFFRYVKEGKQAKDKAELNTCSKDRTRNNSLTLLGSRFELDIRNMS